MSLRRSRIRSISRLITIAIRIYIVVLRISWKCSDAFLNPWLRSAMVVSCNEVISEVIISETDFSLWTRFRSIIGTFLLHSIWVSLLWYLSRMKLLRGFQYLG